MSRAEAEWKKTMPTYVYECEKCGERFEILQGITEPPRKRCPKCRGKLKRIITPGGGFIFKGSGFYETDYKRKEPAVPGRKRRPEREPAGEKAAESPAKAKESKPGADAKGD